MFTCPLHQWASHELSCPECLKSMYTTTSNLVVNPAAPPDEGQEELWRRVANYLIGGYILKPDTDWVDLTKGLVQNFHITKKK